MRVFVLGSEGMLGQCVFYHLKTAGFHVIGMTRRDFDFSSPEKIYEFCLDSLSPSDIVINCCGIIVQRISEFSKEEIICVNSLLPRTICRFCDLIQVSTDCVFSGEESMYRESDIPLPHDLYGITKYLGEDPANSMVLRTSIIGWEQREQKKGLLEWFMSQTSVRGFSNHIWSGVTCLELTRVILAILSEGKYSRGLFHISSGEPISKFELLCLINAYRKDKAKIECFRSDKDVNRSLVSFSQLNLSYKIKSIRNQIEELMIELGGAL